MAKEGMSKEPLTKPGIYKAEQFSTLGGTAHPAGRREREWRLRQQSKLQSTQPLTITPVDSGVDVHESPAPSPDATPDRRPPWEKMQTADAKSSHVSV